MHVFVRSLLAVFLFSTTIVTRAQIDDAIDAPVGEIDGQVSESNPDVMTFLGIPYAEPPVDENRWRAPQLITEVRRVRASAYGAKCYEQADTTISFGIPSARGFAGQFGRGGGGGGGFGGGGGRGFGGGGFGRGGFGGPVLPSSEDCLFLNIWSGAESEDAGAPVMVWIGGDRLMRGAGSDPQYVGETLAGRGVVVVNFNYRLGAYGFLAHPALTAEADTSGNYGLMDAIAALKWVNTNIEAFGGDPNNITVFSASAGAGMTAALIASPEAKGLFGKAILQSGTWMGSGISKMQTLAEAEAIGQQQLASLGDLSLKDLRDLPPAQLTSRLPEPQIIVDGRYIPRDVAEIFESGQQNGVDVLAGSNREEGVTFLERSSIRTAQEYEMYVRERFGSLADEFLRIYPSGTSLADTDTANRVAAASNVTALGDELAWAMRHVSLSQFDLGNSDYVYEFTRVPPPASGADSAPPASVHGAEIAYVFNNMGQTREWTDGDRQLAQVIASYWINFAENGSPNGNHRWQDVELPPWPIYSGADEFQAMELGDRIDTNPVWQISQEKLDLFDRVFESLVLN